MNSDKNDHIASDDSMSDDDDKEVAENRVRQCVKVQNPLIDPQYSLEQFLSITKDPQSDVPNQPSTSQNSSSIFFGSVQGSSISNNNSDIICGSFYNEEEFSKRINKHDKLKNLQLNNCSIKETINQVLRSQETLRCLSFEKCDDNTFEVFKQQKSLTTIKVFNNSATYNGFPHDAFNEICENCKNLEHVVLIGAGTGSYFDADEFPFKIKYLETTSITHHWYAGLNTPRIGFLKSQKDSLKGLTIHELPYDFDGGEVLKHILDEMKTNLDTFYYGKIPLILNGQLQEIKEFSASEIQITSAIEMINQFPSIRKFTLIISNTDVASVVLEKVLKSSAEIFNKLEEFEVIDNQSGLFGVFFELYKNLKGAQKITFRSNDSNVFKIIQELSTLPKLKEIEVTQDIPDKFTADFKITKIADNNDEQRPRNFGGNLREAARNNANEPGGNRHPQENEDDDMQGGDGQEDDNANNNRNNLNDGFPANSVTGMIIEGNGVIDFQSDRAVPILIRQEDQNVYYIDPLGYYRIIFTTENVEQLISFFGENSPFRTVRATIGKITFSLINNNQVRLNKVQNIISRLVFVPYNTNIKLQLITSQENSMIQLCCYIQQNMTWKSFLVQISRPNYIESSLWLGQEPVPEGDRGFRVDFLVDGKSFSQIQARGRQLPLGGTGPLIAFQVVHDPYIFDIDRLIEMTRIFS